MAFSFNGEKKPQTIVKRYKKDTKPHDIMCEIGRKWALRAPSSKGGNMHLSFSEIGCQSQKENPDVFAIHSSGETIVLEAKVSRADFLKDAQKEFRANPDLGMGDFRYYICPPNLIKEEELHGTKWGLIYAHPDSGRCKVIRGFASYGNSGKAAPHEHEWKFTKNQTAENDLILSLLIRVGLGIDLSTLIDNFKFCSKYANAQNRGDVVSALIRSCERAGAYDELTKLIDKTKGSHNCPDCIERRAKDMRRMQRDMRRIQKGN